MLNRKYIHFQSVILLFRYMLKYRQLRVNLYNKFLNKIKLRRLAKLRRKQFLKVKKNSSSFIKF